ncbi:MAG TPA: glycosyltransferase family 2 protein [Candidatus Krumholzibacteria bacterium]|nr:glycosyltransferase family 2 protein [Candidatus Krumholzibacteria bacterium]
MWLFLFWASLALVLYPYAGYPAILYLLGRLRRRHDAASSDLRTPSVCLVISAFNEEAVIRQKIENSLALERRGAMKIVVASDGSNDRTVTIARGYEARGVVVDHFERRRGKNAVLNEVVKAAVEDIIVFTDANCMFAPDAVVRLLERFENPAVGCVVGGHRYAEDATSAGQSESLYWRYESRIKALESSIGSVVVANGPIFAVRRTLFRDLFTDVGNDLQTPLDVASLGYETVYEPRAMAVERATDLWEEEFGRKVRMVMRGLTAWKRMRSHMSAQHLWQFISHKLIRWCVGALLVITLVSSAVLARDNVYFAAFLALQLLCYAAAFAGFMMRRSERMPGVLKVPFYFTMVNFAAMVAMGRFVIGGRQSMWEKAESTRKESTSNPFPANGRTVEK